MVQLLKVLKTMSNKYMSQAKFVEITKSVGESLYNIANANLDYDTTYEIVMHQLKSFVNAIQPIKEVEEEDIK